MEILDFDLASDPIGEAVVRLGSSTTWDQVSDQNSLEALVTVARRLTAELEGADRVVGDDVRTFIRRSDSPWGLAILRNLPECNDQRRALLLLAELLGNVVRFEDEGDYLIEVKEDPIAAAKRPGFNNSKEFFPHTDLSYAPSPPIFFCLHSIENDILQGGLSEFVDIQEIAGLLPRNVVNVLKENEFLFPAPQHYGGGGSVQRPILQDGAGERYSVRFRRDNLRALSRRGIDAVVELCRTIQNTLTEVFLEPGAVAIIDNRRVLHGRTAFLGGAAAERPRHINRLYFKPLGEGEG